MKKKAGLVGQIKCNSEAREEEWGSSIRCGFAVSIEMSSELLKTFETEESC